MMLLPALLLCGGLAKADLCGSNGEAHMLIFRPLEPCTIGDKTTYSDFVFLPSAGGGATPVTASSVVAGIINNGMIANGFDFAMSLDAGSGQTNDVQIGYDVTVTAPSTNLIASSSLSVLGGGAGTGEASVVETDCIGAPVSSCPAGDSFQLNSFSGVFNSSVSTNSFSGVTELGVSKDINVSGGTVGFASISGVTDTVDQVAVATPEPASIVFFGTILLGLTALVRKKQVKRS